jgi:hypothetical protein
MTLSKGLSLALIVEVARASPVLNNPFRALGRGDLLKPSAYPLGDACSHKWQYLHFGPKDDEGKDHLQTLHGIPLLAGKMCLRYKPD